MKDWGTGFSFRTGYKVMRCFRMRYLQPSPGSRSSSITIDRPDHQASHRARRRQGVAWIRRNPPRHRSAGQPWRRLRAALRKIVAGTKKHPRPNQETDMPRF